MCYPSKMGNLFIEETTMSHIIEYVANVYDKETKKLITTKKILKKEVIFPDSINDLGMSTK